MTPTFLPPPLCRHLLLDLVQGRPFPQHGPSPLLHPEPHPLDSSTLQGAGAGLHVPWSLCSSCHGTLPSSHPCASALGLHQILINHKPPLWFPESPPHSHPPSPGAPLFCLHANPREGVSPEPCPRPVPQSQALSTISSAASCPSSTVGILPLVHCPPPWPSSPSLWFLDTSKLSLPQQNLCFMPLGQLIFP